MPNEEFVSNIMSRTSYNIMSRTSYILMSWWYWCPLCTRPTRWAGFVLCWLTKI